MRYSRARRQAIKNSIDITPLMDLTFMLLIIFVITVPVLEYNTDIRSVIPEMNNPKKQEIKKDSLYTVQLDEEGKIYFQDGLTSLETLQDTLATVRDVQPDMTLWIRADAKRSYEEVIAIMRVAKHAGVQNISLVTQAESAAPKGKEP
jgi:biopolymer transport protein ExbD